MPSTFIDHPSEADCDQSLFLILDRDGNFSADKQNIQQLFQNNRFPIKIVRMDTNLDGSTSQEGNNDEPQIQLTVDDITPENETNERDDKTKTDETDDKNKTDETNEKSKMDETNEKNKIEETNETSKMDEANEESKTDEANEESKTDEANEKSKTDETHEKSGADGTDEPHGSSVPSAPPRGSSVPSVSNEPKETNESNEANELKATNKTNGTGEQKASAVQADPSSNLVNSSMDIVPSTSVDAGSEATSTPFPGMQPAQLERLETALVSEQARLILGENIAVICGMLSVDDFSGSFLQKYIDIDHCYTNLLPSSDPNGPSPFVAGARFQMMQNAETNKNTNGSSGMGNQPNGRVNNNANTPDRQLPQDVSQVVSVEVHHGADESEDENVQPEPEPIPGPSFIQDIIYEDIPSETSEEDEDDTSDEDYTDRSGKKRKKKPKRPKKTAAKKQAWSRGTPRPTARQARTNSRPRSAQEVQKKAEKSNDEKPEDMQSMSTSSKSEETKSEPTKDKGKDSGKSPGKDKKSGPKRKRSREESVTEEPQVVQSQVLPGETASASKPKPAKQPKKENKRGHTQSAEDFGPALFSVPDIIRRVPAAEGSPQTTQKRNYTAGAQKSNSQKKGENSKPPEQRKSTVSFQPGISILKAPAKISFTPVSRPKSLLKKPRIEAVPQPELETAPDTEVISAPQPELETAPDVEVISAPQPELESSPDVEIISAPQPELGTSPDIEIISAPQPELETTPILKSDSATKSKTESAARSKPESPSKSKSDSAARSKSDTIAESKSKSAPESKPNSDSKSNAEDIPESKIESVPKSKSDPTPKSKSGSAPKSKPDAANKSKSKSSSKSKAEPAHKSKIESNPESKTKPPRKPKIKTFPKSKIESSCKSKSESTSKSKAKSLLKPQSKSTLQQKPESSQKKKGESASQSKTESTSQFKIDPTAERQNNTAPQPEAQSVSQPQVENRHRHTDEGTSQHTVAAQHVEERPVQPSFFGESSSKPYSTSIHIQRILDEHEREKRNRERNLGSDKSNDSSSESYELDPTQMDQGLLETVARQAFRLETERLRDALIEQEEAVGARPRTEPRQRSRKTRAEISLNDPLTDVVDAILNELDEQEAEIARNEQQSLLVGDPPRNVPPPPDEPNGGEPRRDEPNGGEPRRDEPIGGEPRRDEPIGGESRRDEPNGGEPRRDEPIGGESRRDGPNGGEPRRDGPNGGEPRRDGPNGGEPRRDGPNGGEPRRDGPNGGEPSRGEPRRDEPSRDEPNRDGPSRDEPSRDEPNRDEPNRGDPSRDEPNRGEQDNDDMAQPSTSGLGNNRTNDDGNEDNNGSEGENSEVDSDTDDALSEASWNSEDDPDRLWCVCRKPHNNRFMICCDSCEEWFHGKCVGITKSIGRQMEIDGLEWSCPRCILRRNGLNPDDDDDDDDDDEGDDAEDDDDEENEEEDEDDEDNEEEEGGEEENEEEGGEEDKGEDEENTSQNNNEEEVNGDQGEQELDGEPSEPQMYVVSDSDDSEEYMTLRPCIACERMVKARSLYCSDACIVQHAETALAQLRADNGLQLLPRPDAPGPSNDSDDERIPQVIVMDPFTRQVLVSHETPTVANLSDWLRDNQTFEIVYNKHETGRYIVTTPKEIQIPKRQEEIGVRHLNALADRNRIRGSDPLRMAAQHLAQQPDTTVTVIPVATRRGNRDPSKGEQIPRQKDKEKAPAAGFPNKDLRQGSEKGQEEKDKEGEEEKKNANEKIRAAVRRTLSESLKDRIRIAEMDYSDEYLGKLVNEIEEQLLQYFEKVDAKYKSRYRSLFFNIKDPKNPVLFRKVLDGSISPKNLVRLSPEELASPELARWREKENQHQLEIIKKSELELMSIGNTYIMKSHKGEEVIESADGEKVAAVAAEIDPNTPAQDLVSALNSVAGVRAEKEDEEVAKDLDDDHSQEKALDSEVELEPERAGESELVQEGSIPGTEDVAEEEEEDEEEEDEDMEVDEGDGDNNKKNDDDEDKDDPEPAPMRGRRGSGHQGSKERESRRKERGQKRTRSRSRGRSKSHRSKNRSTRYGDKHRYRHKDKKSKRGKRDSSDSRDSSESRDSKDARGSSNSRHSRGSRSQSSLDSNERTKKAKARDEKTLTTTVDEDANHEPSSIVTLGTSDINTEEPNPEPQSESGPASVLVPDPYLTLEPSPGPKPQVDPGYVWKGIVTMAEVAKFSAIVKTVNRYCRRIAKDIGDKIEMVGRIGLDTVWEYVAKMIKMPSRDVLLIKILPSSESEKTGYSTLYSYLSRRNRIGVVASTSEAVKDFYLYPWNIRSPLPQALLALRGNGLEDGSGHNLILGIVVRSKRRMLIQRYLDTGMPIPAFILKLGFKPDAKTIKLLERSHTPSSQDEDKLKKDPRLKKKIRVQVDFNKPPAHEDGDSPYSPGDSDEELALLSKIPKITTPDISPQLQKFLSTPSNPENLKDPIEIQKKIDEMNRAIEEQKQQIQSLASAVPMLTANVPLPNMSLIPTPMVSNTSVNLSVTKPSPEIEELPTKSAEQGERPKSPPGSFTQMRMEEKIPFLPEEEHNFTTPLRKEEEGGKRVTLPPNLQEILNSINKKSGPETTEAKTLPNPAKAVEEIVKSNTPDINMALNVLTQTKGLLHSLSSISGSKESAEKSDESTPILSRLSDEDIIRKAKEMEQLTHDDFPTSVACLPCPVPPVLPDIPVRTSGGTYGFNLAPSMFPHGVEDSSAMDMDERKQKRFRLEPKSVFEKDGHPDFRASSTSQWDDKQKQNRYKIDIKLNMPSPDSQNNDGECFEADIASTSKLDEEGKEPDSSRNIADECRYDVDERVMKSKGEERPRGMQEDRKRRNEDWEGKRDWKHGKVNWEDSRRFNKGDYNRRHGGPKFRKDRFEDKKDRHLEKEWDGSIKDFEERQRRRNLEIRKEEVKRLRKCADSTSN